MYTTETTTRLLTLTILSGLLFCFSACTESSNTGSATSTASADTVAVINAPKGTAEYAVRHYIQSIQIGDIEETKKHFHPDNRKGKVNDLLEIYQDFHNELKKWDDYTLSEEDKGKSIRFTISYNDKNIFLRASRKDEHDKRWYLLLESSKLP